MAAYAALVSVMHVIDNLQLHPRPPIYLHKQQVESLTQKISFLQKFLEFYNPRLGYSTEADPLEIRIADAAYTAEDAIESHIVDQILARSTNHGDEKISCIGSAADGLYEALEKVIEEMASIEKEAMEIKEAAEVQNQLHSKSTPPNSSRSSSNIALNSSMVGVDDVKKQMMEKLIVFGGDLEIISISGMGGTGKTTLARNIYEKCCITKHFGICGWATISQEYNIREIFTEVLRQLIDDVGQHLSDEELGLKLYQHLHGRRYLIIMDDTWSSDALDKVTKYFPDNKNGSRIVVTTRLLNLTSKLASNYNRLEMKLLDETNSWDLLSKTVFGGESCPLELEDIGKEIAKSCKGLPLSIVVVGGLLAKSKHARESWKYIEENLKSIVNLEDDERCLKILHMSYKQLPVHLKPCFLYMGVFPEDEVIMISKLIKLWVAEGFLKPVSGKSLEEMAKEYLKGLIDRNLILMHGLGVTGSIKECKIHDLLRDLSLREAQKERFYTIFTKPPNPQAGIVNAAQRRIVIPTTTSRNEAINALSSMSLARSLTWHFDSGEVLPPLSLRLLRIFESRRFRCSIYAPFPKNLHQLVNSRFLSISNSFSSESKFPGSIWLFWNLQTLIVFGSEWLTGPIDIWGMPHIRHIQCPLLFLSDPPNDQDGIVLENLQTLATIWNFKCSKQVVERIPNIKKLEIYGVDDRYWLTNLDCLDKLESLRCFFTYEVRTSASDSLHSLINFPHSLKKLNLSIPDHFEFASKYCWQDILDEIGALPLLQKLKLHGGRFKEGEWETSEGQFRSLKSLILVACKDLQLWKTESSHFPCLERLYLIELYVLEEIPLEFAEISTLRVIELYLCTNSAALSAKRILKEQEDFYGEETTLQVQSFHNFHV